MLLGLITVRLITVRLFAFDQLFSCQPGLVKASLQSRTTGLVIPNSPSSGSSRITTVNRKMETN
jgi:hypothetical protein